MIKTENVIETRSAEERVRAGQAIAAMIRQSSEAGGLISDSEILRRVADQPHLFWSPADLAKEVGDILRELSVQNEDLQELSSPDGYRHYYSSRFITEAYASLLLQKQGNSLKLIAEIVRQNSAFYPRPIPLDIFTQPPFNLTPQEVLDDLKRMKAEENYRDIESTTTSTSNIFLYSALHLEPEHASMLAEWLDVGQFLNP